MNLLYEKQRLFGTMFRGDGGDGGGGGGGPSGSSGASAEGSGSSSGPGGGPAGASSSSDSGSSSSSSSGASSSSSSDDGTPTADMSGMVGVSDDGSTTTSMNDDGSVNVSATSEVGQADPNQGENGSVTNSVLSNLFSKGVGQVAGQISGLPPSIIANMIKGVSNPSLQNQASIINSFMGVVPVVGPLNGLAGMLGLGTIGSGIASLGGGPAGDVASDPSASGGDSAQPGLGGLFGSSISGGSGAGSPASMLGLGSGDPLLASLFANQYTSPGNTNKFLKDLMNQETQYG